MIMQVAELLLLAFLTSAQD